MNFKNCTFALFIFLFAFSCRTTLEDENNSLDNTVLVSIKASVEEILGL